LQRPARGELVTFDRNPSGMENVQPNIGMKMERKSTDKGIKEVGLNILKIDGEIFDI
jgi:hypothetical protein